MGMFKFYVVFLSLFIAVCSYGAGLSPPPPVIEGSDVGFKNITASTMKLTGELTVGTFTRHHDINVGSALLGPTAPTLELIGLARGLGFDSDAETAYFSVEVSSDWVGTTDMSISVDWAPNTAPSDTETIKWDISYRAVSAGETVNVTSPTDITATYTQSGVGIVGELINTPITIDFDDATNPLTEGDIIFVEFTRDVTGDTFGEIPIVFNLNLAYDANTVAKH